MCKFVYNFSKQFSKTMLKSTKTTKTNNKLQSKKSEKVQNTKISTNTTNTTNKTDKQANITKKRLGISTKLNGLYEIYISDKSERNSQNLFKEIKKNFIPYTNKLISSYTKSNKKKQPIEADDILMEAYYQILRHNNAKEKSGKSLFITDKNVKMNFTAWLKMIIKNEILKVLTHDKEYSKNKVYLSSVTSSGKSEFEFEESDYLFNNINKEDSIQSMFVDNDYITLENEKELSKSFNKIISGIYNLDPKLKDILIDREINQYSYKDISDKYSLNIDTVKTRIFNARREIKKQFTDEYLNYKSFLV